MKFASQPFEYAKKLSKYKSKVIDLDRQNNILNRLYNKIKAA